MVSADLYRRASGRGNGYSGQCWVLPGGGVLRVSEDRVFDLLVELVDFSAEHGLPRTAFALEGAIDAFLQDKGLVPQGLSAPAPRPATSESAMALALAASAPVREALQSGSDGAGDEADAAASPGFRSRRVPTMPRRLHLMPSQRVAV
jgi:hypothetical protein